MRAVVDANVWIAGAISPRGFAIRVYLAAAEGRFVPLTCARILLELKDTYTGRHLMSRYGLTIPSLNELVRLLTVDGEFQPDPEITSICRDPDDDVYIALAVAAGADYLVTRDDDLKGDDAVREHLSAAGVQVVTVREFVAILELGPGRR